MNQFTFYIDKSKTNRKGEAPILINVTINKVKATKAVGKVKPRHWNNIKQRVSKQRPHEPDNGHEEINLFLDNYEKDIKAYFEECAQHNVAITPALAKDYFNGKKKNFRPAKSTQKKISLWEAYDEFLKTGQLEKASNTTRNRLTIKNKLKDFENETRYKMTFESINLAFFDQLKEWVLNTKGHGYNYLSSITDKFKAFMSWSLAREYHANLTYKKFSAPEKEGSIIHLTYQELQQLINEKFESRKIKDDKGSIKTEPIKTAEREKLQRARDFYCFGCLTGLRYCDLHQLTKDHIIDGMIKITTQKTNKDVVIPIFQGLKTIIDRYPDQYRLLPKLSNQKLNDYIKDCCEVAEINTLTEYKTFEKNFTISEFKPKFELIGTHTARKTFICLAYDRGLDVEMIKAITGITREKTLRRYLHISSDSKKEKLIKAFEGL